ncbi:hypothetical protein [Synechococcus sp. CC9616]|uniref:hypothetical protein n=1 Tax=Synechococcus sp. CC9616 TaxID=110663 RepID=UPI00048C7B77|nr:hypothetical protein [Synechococcus sp. CC9616]
MIFATSALQQAIDAADLSDGQRHWLRSTQLLQRGTAFDGAIAAGLSPDDAPDKSNPVKALSGRWNLNLGKACHQIADELGWTKQDKRFWIDLMVTFEDEEYKIDDQVIWVLRPQWVNLHI